MNSGRVKPLVVPAISDGSEPLLLDSTIPYQINKLAFHMNGLLETALKKQGLSMANWRIMAVLDVNSSATVNQLAEYAMIEQSTVSRLIKRMETAGYLVNRPSEKDGRMRNIVLTEHGREKFDMLRDVTMRHVARILDGFDQTDQKNLLTIIHRMQENVGLSPNDADT